MTYYPADHDIYAYQGATFNPIYVSTIDDVPVNYTGYSAKMQIRKYQNSTSELIATLSTANSGIILNAYGMVQPFATAATTAEWPPGNYFYDIELTQPNGVVLRHMQGQFIVEAQVTV